MQLDNRQITELAKPFVAMADSIKEFFNDSENKRKYREWHLQKYGCEPEEV